MLYKLLAAALIVASAEALKFGGATSRRDAIAKAAALALPLVPLCAVASDADVMRRADTGTLEASRAIERARNGDFVTGKTATRAEIEAIIAVDKKAIEIEKEKIDGLSSGRDADMFAESVAVSKVEKDLEAQVKKLQKLEMRASL